MQLTVDDRDLGKNYPVGCVLMGDAKLVLGQMIEEVKRQLGEDGRRGDDKVAREIGAVKDIQIRTLPCRVQKMEKVAPDVMVIHLKLPANERLQFLAGEEAAPGAQLPEHHAEREDVAAPVERLAAHQDRRERLRLPA